MTIRQIYDEITPWNLIPNIASDYFPHVKNNNIKFYLNSNNNGLESSSVNTNDDLPTDLLSDDDENNMSSLSLEKKTLPKKSSILSRMKNMFTSNNASCVKPCYFEKCEKESFPEKILRAMFESRNIFEAIANLTCGLFKQTVRKTIYFILVGLLYIICSLQEFTGQTKCHKIFLAIPGEIIKRLFCFCGMRNCRIINVKGFLTLPDRGSNKCSKKDPIFTKCNWPVWLLALSCFFVIVSAAYFNVPNPTFKQKMEMSKVTAQWLKDRFIANVYYLPGYDCMTNNHCCINRIALAKRWSYCLATLPIRLILSGMTVEAIDPKQISIAIKNITDWKLKKQIKKMGKFSLQVHQRISVLICKTHFLKRLLFRLSDNADKNFTKIPGFRAAVENMEKMYEEAYKKHHEIIKIITMLFGTRKLIVKTSGEVRHCITKERKTIMKLIESEEKRNLQKVKISTHRMNAAMKSGQSNVNTRRDEFESAIKNLDHIVKSQHSAYCSIHIKVMQLDNYKHRFYQEVATLRSTHNLKLLAEMSKHKELHKKAVIRFEKVAVSYYEFIKFFIRKNKPYFKKMIQKAISKRFALIRSELTHTFCTKIPDFVRLTVWSAVNSIQMRKCGFVNNNYHEICNPKVFDEIFNTPMLIKSCFDKIYTKERIEEKIGLYDADQLGLIDYASRSYGAEIFERKTSKNTLHLNFLEPTQQISESSRKIWKLFMQSKHNIISSIKFLNSPKITAGFCWNFVGSEGYTVIKFIRPIIISNISIQHIDYRISLSNRTDIPKLFELIILSNENAEDGYSLGLFLFNNSDANIIQHFYIEEPKKAQYVKVQIHSNYGAEITCVYRIRIHGDL